MSVDRRQARILAMQTLCHCDAHEGDWRRALDALAAENAVERPTSDYAGGVCEHHALAGADVDARIQKVLAQRALERLNAVTRNVLRVAAIELVVKDVPPKVAINEAIEIAREYGDDETARFVNGILDAVRQQIAEEG